MSHSGQLEIVGSANASETREASATPAPITRWERVQRVVKLVRRIVGVPDYDEYLSYMQRQHPECAPMDARTFERERLAEKYKSPGSRCC